MAPALCSGDWVAALQTPRRNMLNHADGDCRRTKYSRAAIAKPAAAAASHRPRTRNGASGHASITATYTEPAATAAVNFEKNIAASATPRMPSQIDAARSASPIANATRSAAALTDRLQFVIQL